MKPASIKLDAPLEALLALRNTLPREVRGPVSNNVAYILRLMEYGHSQQLPAGWLRGRQRTLEELLEGEVRHALTVYPDDLAKAILAGVTTATLGVARDVATATPVDTGRAKGAWVARIPDGTSVQPVVEDAKVISKSQQAAILRQRRKGA